MFVLCPHVRGIVSRPCDVSYHRRSTSLLVLLLILLLDAISSFYSLFTFVYRLICDLPFFFFFFNDPAPPEISPLSLHDALPILLAARAQKSFSLDGLEAVAEGHGGERWAAEVQRLQALSQIARQLDGYLPLADASHGLWRGLETDAQALQDALAFERERLQLDRKSVV